jgi:hypothetical protein
MPSRRDTQPKSTNLTIIEELAVTQHIIYLEYVRVPPFPRLASVKYMAEFPLAERDQKPVGVDWAANLVKRTPEVHLLPKLYRCF